MIPMPTRPTREVVREPTHEVVRRHLGLPGARRLMDEFAVVSEKGRGTTVTMTKWRQER